MNLPNVTNAEVVIVGSAAFLFAVVPALLAVRPRSRQAPVVAPPPLAEGEFAPAVAELAPADAGIPAAEAPLTVPERADDGVVGETVLEVAPPVAIAEPSQPVAPVLPLACLAAVAPTDWPRFRLGDLRRAQLDGVGDGVRLEPAMRLRLEAMELAASLQPRSYVVAAQRASAVEPVLEVLLFEELWPGGVDEAFAAVSLGQI